MRGVLYHKLWQLLQEIICGHVQEVRALNKIVGEGTGGAKSCLDIGGVRAGVICVYVKRGKDERSAGQRCASGTY